MKLNQKAIANLSPDVRYVLLQLLAAYYMGYIASPWFSNPHAERHVDLLGRLRSAPKTKLANDLDITTQHLSDLLSRRCAPGNGLTETILNKFLEIFSRLFRGRPWIKELITLDDGCLQVQLGYFEESEEVTVMVIPFPLSHFVIVCAKK